MRRRLLHGAFVAVLCLFQISSLAQSSNPTPPPPRNDDVEEKRTDQTDPPAPDGIVTLSGESDTPDLPGIAVGSVDSETYLRMRDQHIRFLRGLMDKLFDPRARGQAIRNMKDQERRLRDSQQGNGQTTTGNGGGISNGSGSPSGSNTASILNSASQPTWNPLGPSP